MLPHPRATLCVSQPRRLKSEAKSTPNESITQNSQTRDNAMGHGSHVSSHWYYLVRHEILQVPEDIDQRWHKTYKDYETRGDSIQKRWKNFESELT